MSRALVVVDVQNDFCPGGSLAVQRGDEVATLISRFIARSGEYYQVIVATKCWHPGDDEQFAHFSATPDFRDTWPPHCVRDTLGAEFHPNLDITRVRHVFYKGQNSAAYSGFEGSNDFGETLNAYLHDRAIEDVDVVGIATDFCVHATALDGVRNGYTTTVLLDLTAAVDPDAIHTVAAQMMDEGVMIADALV